MCTVRVIGGAIVFLYGVASSLVAQGDRPTDEWLTDPVDNQTFATFLEFFAYESDLPFRKVVVETVESDGVMQEELTFQSTPGQTVTGRVFLPRGAGTTSRGGVVYLHGAGGRKSGVDSRLTLLMARAGWTVIAIDVLHWGGRRTGLLETYSAREKADRLYNQPSLYLEFVTQTVKDVGRSYALLVEEYGVDPTRIALVGFSRGAQLAMIAGGSDTRPASVALLHGGHFDFFENGHRSAACGANYIGHISPRPLLMINAENDTDYLPETAVRPLQRLVGESSTIRWTEFGHGVLSAQDHAFLVEWLRTAVP